MSTDMKAAMEWATSWAASIPDSTEKVVAAAFLEVTAELEQAKQQHKDASANAHMHYTNSGEWKRRAESAEQRAADLQAQLERMEAHAEALAFALDGMSADTNVALPQAFHDYRQRATSAQPNAAAGQEAALSSGEDEAPSGQPAPSAAPSEVAAWARDLLVYLDVDVESLPEVEYKIYEEGYDKTIAGLQAALAGGQTESAAQVGIAPVTKPDERSPEPAAADPALPGLELAAWILGPQSDNYNINGHEAIRAEIERRTK